MEKDSLMMDEIHEITYRQVKCEICGETFSPTTEKQYVYSGKSGKCWNCYTKGEIDGNNI